MFPLFQRRDFSALISDTFSFLKVEGKDFYKQYLTLMAIPIALLILFIYFTTDFSIDAIQFNNSEFSFDDSLFNPTTLVLGIIALIILGLIIGLFCYSFPVFYLKNMAEATTEIPNQTNITKQIKNNLGRLFIFLIGTSFIVIPIFMILFVLAGFLSVILIGIPLLLLLIPTFYSFISLSFYEYLSKETTFFKSLGVALDDLKANYWTIIGNSIIMYLILFFINYIPLFIFNMTIMGGSFLNFQTTLLELPKWIIVLYYCLSTILSLFTSSILLINQGLVYYSERERKESVFFRSQIDNIGSANEQ